MPLELRWDEDELEQESPQDGRAFGCPVQAAGLDDGTHSADSEVGGPARGFSAPWELRCGHFRGH